MADLDWSKCEAVESIPGKVSGAWVFKDTRMPVSVIFANLASGVSMTEIMKSFHISKEQYQAVLEFALDSLDNAPNLVKRTGTPPPWVETMILPHEDENPLELADARSA